MAEFVKTIKPKRLDVAGVKRRLEVALKTEGNQIAVEYRKTVANWSNPPKFEVLTDISGGDLVIIVGPTGNADAVQHWVWTNDGTEPHIIRGNPRLFFGTSGGKAKTTPGVVGSNPGVIAGPPLTSPQSVNHPGTRARGWTDKIMNRTRRKRINQRLIEASRVEAK